MLHDNTILGFLQVHSNHLSHFFCFLPCTQFLHNYGAMIETLMIYRLRDYWRQDDNHVILWAVRAMCEDGMQNYFNLECLVKICCYGESLVYYPSNEQIVSMYRKHDFVWFEAKTWPSRKETHHIQPDVFFNQMLGKTWMGEIVCFIFTFLNFTKCHFVYLGVCII